MNSLFQFLLKKFIKSKFKARFTFFEFTKFVTDITIFKISIRQRKSFAKFDIIIQIRKQCQKVFKILVKKAETKYCLQFVSVVERLTDSGASSQYGNAKHFLETLIITIRTLSNCVACPILTVLFMCINTPPWRRRQFI